MLAFEHTCVAMETRGAHIHQACQTERLRRRGLDNPLGLLLKCLPLCFSE